MENLAHTLLGLSLAKSGLERATPLATTALVISSNLPDLDVLSRVEGGTVGYLEYHRGFTHGFVGGALVWLTATTATRTVVWLVIGTLASLAVALALRHPYDPQTIAIPSSVRGIWFGGLAIVIAGALFRWRRLGPRLVRYSLLLLALYYGGTWMAHQSALQAARISLTSLRPEGAASMAAWPAPANPLFWQSAAKSSDAIYDGSVNLLERREQWRELPALDPKLADALRQSRDARVFLDFMRYGTANVEQRE